MIQTKVQLKSSSLKANPNLLFLLFHQRTCPGAGVKHSGAFIHSHGCASHTDLLEVPAEDVSGYRGADSGDAEEHQGVTDHLIVEESH